MYIEKYIRHFDSVTDSLSLNTLLAHILNELNYKTLALLSLDLKKSESLSLSAGQLSETLEDEFFQLEPRFFSVSDYSLKPYYLPLDKKTTHYRSLLIPIPDNHIIRYFTLLELPSPKSQHELDPILWFWQLISQYMKQAYLRISKETRSTDIHLTAREIECLSWAAKGKTSWEVGKILGLSERTINFHINNCLKKTNSVNRQQAISKCIQTAII